MDYLHMAHGIEKRNTMERSRAWQILDEDGVHDLDLEE